MGKADYYTDIEKQIKLSILTEEDFKITIVKNKTV